MVANQTLFPAVTCVGCAFNSGKIYEKHMDGPRIQWGNMPRRPTALEKHREVHSDHQWYDLMGLYGELDTMTPRYRLRQCGGSDYVYLLEDIEKNHG